MRFGSDRGQATVEFLAIVPLLVLVGLALWQSVAVVERATLAADGARAVARAVALGADPRTALERAIPAEDVAKAVIHKSRSVISVSLPVKLVVTGGPLTRVTASAGFPEQTQ
jgi:Flp pilus assembly protein TadG